jgi:hypothetical protein
MPDDGVFPRLFRSVGRHSRYAGLGFVALSIAFLVLAVYDGFVVFEVDSVIALLAAIFLLFRDPRARIQAGVLDAILITSDKAIAELTGSPIARFTYVTTGKSVDDVVVIPADYVEAPVPNTGSPDTPPLIFTPPGRGLAKPYTRETGLTQLTMDALSASLSETMREGFGLARSVDIDSKDDGVKITLHGASATCNCVGGPTQTAGTFGCTIASFLAVLVTTATKRSVTLERCVHEASMDTWTISMRLGQSITVSN